MDGGAWWAVVRGVARSQTRLRDFLFTFHFSLSCIGEGNGNPLQCSCLENPRDGGAWWASVYGVAQGRTRLKRLSSSSMQSSCCSVTKSCSTICNSRDCSTPGPSAIHCLTACSNPWPLSQWCYLTVSSSAACLSLWLQYFPASGSFPLNQLIASSGQDIGASASVLPMNCWC